MFKSKKRPIIIPQLEHARLSGYLAYFWGNEDVALSPIDHKAFVAGVTHHDRGYGHLDTMGIGEVDSAVWLATQKRGILRELADPIADGVALIHIRRLLNYAESNSAEDVITLAEQRIEQAIAQTPYTRQDFENADTITDICDMISFIFCFEEAKQFTKPVFSDGESIPMQVTLVDTGKITLDPYPLSISELSGFILGYEASSYPDHPEPVMVEYTITPA